MGESGITTNWAGVQKEDLLQALPLVSHWIKDALDVSLGETNFGEIVDRLNVGTMQMWLIGDEESLRVLGVLLTEVQDYAKTKVLNVHLCGGENLDDWFPHWETLEEWGKEQGCEFITATGRRGWKRKLAPLGFKEKYVTLYKPLFRSH